MVQPIPPKSITSWIWYSQALAGVLLFASGFSLAWAQELTIEFQSVSAAEVQVKVSGPDGESVLVEMSSDLTDWSEFRRGRLDGGVFTADDPVSSEKNWKRFYRARLLGEDELLELLQEFGRVLAGDTIALRLNGGSGADWEWSVNGVVGGNSVVGTIRSSPNDSSVAYYTAPVGSSDQSVTIRAVDVNDESRSIESGLLVSALPGDLVLVPGNTVLGVGEIVQFQAGIQFLDIGFLPFRSAIWKLNGVIGGDPVLGHIGLDGVYRAPAVLPDELPATIEVGYSLTVEQSPLQQASITIVDVEVTPGEVVRFFATDDDFDPPSQLVAKRYFSDGTTETPAPSSFLWESDREESVTVGNDGLLTMLAEPGQAIVTATDLTHGIRGTATIKSREPVYFYTVEGQTLGDVSFDTRFGLFEVTEPDATLVLDPRIRATRSPFYQVGGPEPEHFSGRDINAITYSASGDIVDYNQFGRIVQNTGITGRIEEKVGVIEFGDVPGTGDITVSYDDGEWQNEVTLSARYTQLDMAVEVKGSQTEGTSDVFISEWIDFEVQLTNPFEDVFGGGGSKFIGRMEIEVDTVEGDEFWVAYDQYIRDGELPPRDGSASQTTSLDKTDTFSGFVAPIFNSEGSGFGVSPHPNTGKARFSISPTRTGEMTFRIRVLNDPNIPEQTFTLNVQKPTLELEGFGGRPVPPDNRLPAGHWLPVVENPDQPSIRSIGFASSTWSDQYPPQWHIQRPDGRTLETPLVNERFDYNEFFDEPGEYRIRMELVGRPEISTEEIVIDSPDLDSLSWPALGDNPWRNYGVPVPASMVVGGVKVISPKRAVWKPGVGIPVVLQLYDGAGNATNVGYTTHDIYEGGAAQPRVPQSRMVYMQPSRAEGPSFATSYPKVLNEFGNLQDQRIDSTGRQEFTLTPVDFDYSPSQNRQDMLVRFSLGPWNPQGAFFEGEQLFNTVRTFNSDTLVYDITSTPERLPPILKTAEYQTEEWEALHNFYMRISGHGVIFQPRRLPIPSERVRAAVVAGDLPASAAQIQVTVVGTDGFAEALAEGFSGTMDLGEGLTLVGHQADGDELHLTIESDATFWATAATNQLTVREVELPLGDGTEWAGEFELFRAELDPLNPNDEADLPLNARYGLNSPVGSVGFDLERQGIAFPQMRAELIPSIHASWDADRDGVADPDEDTNSDGRFTSDDVGEGASGFRGQFAASPLVGFSRWADSRTGGAIVRDLSVTLNPATKNAIWVHGNTTDLRRLSPSLQLGSTGEPDQLPDFVSTATDGEQITLRAGENYADYRRFTVYNFTTEYQAFDEDPNINFDDLKAELRDSYRQYSQFDLPTNTEDVAGDPRVTRPISVWVDHEAVTDFQHFRPIADPENPSSLSGYLQGLWPTQYYGGILDQYYQANNFRGNVTPLGRDGRVRSYSPLDPPGTPTGTTRYPFGVALDGVLYDAFVGALPRPRLRDAFYSVVTTGSPSSIYGAQLAALNRFDFNPNSSDITGIDIVADLIAETGGLSEHNLLPRLGGVSGGFLDVRDDSAPTFFVESSLPGARLPGVHAGYLTRGSPEQLTDPTTELVEDDLEEVSIVRNGGVGQAIGNPPIAEDVFLGTTQPRRVMSFGSSSDKKAPLGTAVRVSAGFKIGTDPLDYAPQNLENWKIKAGMAVSEKQDFSNLGVDLLVTTQSDGDEQAQKIVADAVIDLAVDLAANAILTTITSGGYLAACADDVVAQVATASMTLGVGLAEERMLDLAPGTKGPLSTYMSGTVNGFETPQPGWSPDPVRKWASGIVVPADTETGIRRLANPSKAISQPGIFNHCDLAKVPFNLLKDRIKASFSARTLGGLGASEAAGFKVLAICIPADAQVGNGVFSAYTSYSRRAFIQPKEQATKKLSELPWDSIWDSYPYPDEVSDEDLLVELLRQSSDPTVGEDAKTILRAAGAFSLQREMQVSDIEEIDSLSSEYPAALVRESSYQSYKLRTFPMHEIGLYIGPGHQVDANGENAFGDFILTPNDTEIPVSYGAVATAARTNENANARATIRHHGIDLQLIGIVIQDPANLPPPETP